MRNEWSSGSLIEMGRIVIMVEGRRLLNMGIRRV
jgi:hypothetical protein